MSRKLPAEFYTETATEHQETAAVIQRANLARGLWPELALLFHVPNEAKRSRSVAARLKAEGMKSGVPDLILPVARGVYHGLAIEMKRAKGGKLSDNQAEWVNALKLQGWQALVCCGQDEAWSAIEQYMSQGQCLSSALTKICEFIEAQEECDRAFAAEDTDWFTHAEKRRASSLHELVKVKQALRGDALP